MCIFGKIWEDEMCKIPSMFSPPSLSFLLPTYPKYFRSPCKSVYIKHLERGRERVRLRDRDMKKKHRRSVYNEKGYTNTNPHRHTHTTSTHTRTHTEEGSFKQRRCSVCVCVCVYGVCEVCTVRSIWCVHFNILNTFRKFTCSIGLGEGINGTMEHIHAFGSLGNGLGHAQNTRKKRERERERVWEKDFSVHTIFSIQSPQKQGCHISFLQMNKNTIFSQFEIVKIYKSVEKCSNST